MTRGRLGLLLLSLFLAAGLIYGFLPRPVPVSVAVANRGSLQVTVEEEGKTRVTERYVISVPTSGYVRRIALKEGDRVVRGQVLAILESTRSAALDPRNRAQARARVGAAEAALAAARQSAREAAAEADLARQELTRSQQLGQSGFLSPQAVDQARTASNRNAAARQAAEHQVEVARFELANAKAVLAYSATIEAGGVADAFDVRAPLAATVLKVLRQSEGAVVAGEPLIEIGNPENLEVEVDMLSTSAVKLVPGARVVFERWGGEAVLEGRVRVIEPRGFTKISALGVEEQRVRVIVAFTSPRKLWQRLGDGYRVEAVFVVWESPDVLQIPASALFRHNGGWAAFTVEHDKAHIRPLRIGQRTGLAAQVLEGIRAGENVIAHPDDRVADGVRVKPRGDRGS